MKRVGLTLGKFAPFHKGHQHLLEAALSEVDEMMVIVYQADEVTAVPLSVRSAWIRDLYPDIRVIEAPDGPQCVGDTPEIRARHEDYLIKTLRVSGITHFYSSEFYGDHISRALGAENRQVDPERLAVPVSGTLIRRDPYAFRHAVDARVYRDLIRNVVFVGAPGTGKTTLTRALAERMGTVFMPEYGREHWMHHQKNRRLSEKQLLEIAEGHLAREEDRLLDARRFLFTDTNAITTAMFSLDYHGVVHPDLEALARVAETRYDHVFVCDTDIPFESTWDRSGPVKRDIFQDAVIRDLNRRRMVYTRVSGTLDQRMETVISIIDPERNLP